MTIKEILEKRAKALADARAILDKADAEKRSLSAEETASYDAHMADVQKHGDDAKRRESLAREEAINNESAGRQTGAAASSPALTSPGHLDLPRGRRMELAAHPQIAALATPEYRRAFASFLGGGAPSAGMLTTDDARGGFWAPTTLSAQLIKFMDDLVWMRSISNVLPPLTNAVSLGVPSFDTDYADADWTAEVPTSDITEDDAARSGKREFVPSLLSKLVKVSLKMIRASVIDVESFLAERLAYRFAITEEKGFLTGNGSQQPLGIFTAHASGISTSRDVTASATTSFNADDVFNTFYGLKQSYRANSSWVMNRAVVKMAAKLKDSSGQYLWNLSSGPGAILNAGAPSQLLGRPVYESEYAPSTFTTGLYMAVCGDFKSGYWIADSLMLGIQRLNELFALKNQVGLVGRKETDGAPVLGEAFSRLILA